MRRLFLLSLTVLMIGLPQTTTALQVDRVLYDPSGTDSGHEWLSIVNDDQDPINLTNWRLQIGDQSHHKLIAYPDVEKEIVLGPGQRATVTAKPDVYLQDNLLSGEVVIKSSISLPNSGDAERIPIRFYDANDNLRYEMDYPLIDDLDPGGELHLNDEAWEIVLPVGSPSPHVAVTETIRVSDAQVAPSNLSPSRSVHPEASGIPNPHSSPGQSVVASRSTPQAAYIVNDSLQSSDRRLLLISFVIAVTLFVLSLGIAYWQQYKASKGR